MSKRYSSVCNVEFQSQNGTSFVWAQRDSDESNNDGKAMKKEAKRQPKEEERGKVSPEERG